MASWHVDMLSLRHDGITERPKNKRQDPNYTKLTADIEKDIVFKIRAICALLDISLSEAVGDALKMWIEKQKKDKNFEI